MQERNTGAWALLRHASIYTVLQNLIGGPGLRRYLVERYLRPWPGARVLDVGCGPADFLPLLDGVEYVGVDHNAGYIAQAQARHGARGTFLTADVSAEDSGIEGSFDLILAIGVLHHLDDAQCAAVLAGSRRRLRPQGRLVSIDPVLTPRQHPLARLIISQDRGRHVRNAAGYQGLAEAAGLHVAPELRTDLLRLPYTHLVMECAGA